MTLTFDNPAGTLWLVSAAAVAALGIGVALWRRRAAARFADAALLPRIAPGLSLARGMWRAALLGGAASCLAVALMDPRAAEQTEELTRRGADIMFVVDVSRSMLAEDATPNRLERARTFISDAIDAMGGDRAGLIDFAGVAAMRAPLTLNYDALKSAVDGLETKDSRRGGSMLGDAIRLAAESFPTDDAGHAIVILSDGEDMGSDPVDAAKEAAERGIRIITVGIGDPREGARIPVGDGPARRFLVHEGEEVWSRMDAATLRDVADATGGLFVPAGTAQVELGEILTRTLGDLERTEGESSVARTTAPLFQWPAALALLLLVTESVIAARARSTPAAASGAATFTTSASASGQRPAPRRRRRAGQPQPHALARASAVAVAACAALAGMGPVARADDAPARPRTVGRGQIDRAAFRDAVTRANAAMRSGQYADAAAAFSEAMDADPTNAAAAYNRGVAEYRGGKLDEAASSFAEAASRGDAALAADAMFNQGNATYQSALRALQGAAPDASTAGSAPPPSPDAQPDLAAASEAVSQALTHYKDAIAANPSDVDSRVNAELAHTLLKQLREMQQQQQQQQNQQDQKEQQQDKRQEERQDDQQQQQQNGGECDNPQQDGGEGTPSRESSGKPPSEGSSSESDPSGETQPKDGDQPKDQDKPKDQPQDPGKDGPDAPKEDPSTDADQKSGQPESAGSDPKEPQKDDGAGKPASDQKRPPTPAQARGGDPVPGAPLTKSEAERLLQGVRDRAKQRTDAKERAERVRQVPAVRDW